MKRIKTIIEKVKCRFAAVRRCSQPMSTESNITETAKPEAITAIETEKIHVEIFFYDGTSLSYNRKRDNVNESYVHAYYPFYRWLFMREDSAVFTFDYNGGAQIFYRKDIKRVHFYTTKEAENFA